ncbi:chromosome segregation protein SMC [Thalassotalea crassostreae]|uniref:chromosome segregation protein SMC n=1 Tax=Thalassotalea crassostreae TaxID=1763536 RepID=UPI000839470D|nr:chromosome segregation protein SMC [Thalassotalea crassostreae]
MRLKQIKLAGFKSFVDLTTVPFPQKMTAIVGPNGCGKSNIIDAVRWVLGESSAKNLRGDSMTDVIFNGSSARKPVGQASVELLFDNSDHRITGSMADRNEISIRRVVNRDSQNTYFLNGSKCRRKDITDIFLGTGLGPRSYAIIEQGTISKLIESKPQELRVFIEEAAGVSKYKERRRDTETRIRHTRENLTRLADIRQELATQLEHLHGQSQAAIRFKSLKAEERKLRAELAVLKYLKYQSKVDGFNKQQLKLNTELESWVAKQREAELAIVQARENQDKDGDQLAKQQQQKLSITAKISHIEQDLKHSQQRKLSIKDDIQRITSNYNSTKQHLNSHQQTQKELAVKLLQVTPELSSSEQQLAQCEQDIAQLQLKLESWQADYNIFLQQQMTEENERSLIAEKIKLGQDLLAKTKQQCIALQQQKQAIDLEQLSDDLSKARNILDEQDILVSDANEQLALSDANLLTAKEALEVATQSFNDGKMMHQNLESKQDLLTELNDKKADWQVAQQQHLQQLGFNDSTTLLKQLTVSSGWELAVEMALGYWLNANCIEQLSAQMLEQIGLASAAIISVDNKMSENPDKKAIKPGTLAEQVSGQHPFNYLLNNIFVAKDEASARAILPSLTAEQSVICKHGVWFSKKWYRKGSLNEQSGALERENELKTIAIEKSNVSNELTLYQRQLEQREIELKAVESENRHLRQHLQTSQLDAEKQRQHVSYLENELEQKLNLSKTLAQQLSDIEQSLVSDSAQLEILLTQQKRFQNQKPNSSAEEKLLKQKQELASKNSQKVEQRSEIQERVQQFKLAIERASTQKHSVEVSITREQQQLDELSQQQQKLLKQQDEIEQPLDSKKQQLQQLLEQSTTLDNDIQLLHQSMAKSNAQIDEFNIGQHNVVESISNCRDKLALIQVEAENYRVRSKTILEQLSEMQQTLEQVLECLPESAKESQWQVKLARVNKSISQLGAINLAAIDEFEQQSQRKEFLDSQNDDLEAALSTLEAAINKIDKETRQRFKDTFEQVNSDLKVLFPKVFGGGSAYLDLTGEDLLDTGVTIMARPPGKKNSTIHLLSGGEKALTALSLVFAIFRLNPAPFCMLDEVDAPLDDANVNRFCKLVEEMSQSVQFIYISHNKIAMEMASHLTGVTMFEPGVSRMVAVDIDEAVAMAEAV